MPVPVWAVEAKQVRLAVSSVRGHVSCALGAEYGYVPSQPELVGNPVSLRPPNWPKGGAMDLLGIPGLNLAQESGREGLEPSQGGAFLRPRLHWRVGKKSEF